MVKESLFKHLFFLFEVLPIPTIQAGIAAYLVNQVAQVVVLRGSLEPYYPTIVGLVLYFLSKLRSLLGIKPIVDVFAVRDPCVRVECFVSAVEDRKGKVG